MHFHIAIASLLATAALVLFAAPSDAQTVSIAEVIPRSPRRGLFVHVWLINRQPSPADVRIDEYLRDRLMPVDAAIPHLPGVEMYGDSIPDRDGGRRPVRIHQLSAPVRHRCLLSFTRRASSSARVSCSTEGLEDLRARRSTISCSPRHIFALCTGRVIPLALPVVFRIFAALALTPQQACRSRQKNWRAKHLARISIPIKRLATASSRNQPRPSAGST